MKKNYSDDEKIEALEEYQKRIGILSSYIYMQIEQAFEEGVTPAMIYKAISICEGKKIRSSSYFIYLKFNQDEDYGKLIENELILENVRTEIVEPLAALEYEKTMNVSSIYTSQFNNENSFVFYPVQEALEYLFYPQIIKKKLERALGLSQDADKTSRNMEKPAFYSNPQLQNKIKRHLRLCMKMKIEIKTINYSSLFDFYT